MMAMIQSIDIRIDIRMAWSRFCNPLSGHTELIIHYFYINHNFRGFFALLFR